MRTFFRGRLGVLLGVICACALVLDGAQAAATTFSATLIAQPTDMQQAPSPYMRAVVTQPPPAPVEQPSTPSATSDGPFAGTPVPSGVSTQATRPPTYRCSSGRDMQATVANCVGSKHSNNLFWIVLVGVVIAALIGTIVSRTSFSSGNNGPNEQTLLEQGPQLPVSYPDGSLSVQAFARDGWPVVVDFEPQPGTVTQLQVTTMRGHHHHTEKIVLDPDGSHGRQLVKVAIPETGSAYQPVPATYVVSSVPLATFDTDQPQAIGLAPLKIYGIGGGPHAVGSVAIEQLAFTSMQPGARFTYFAKSEFNRARAQVQQLQRASDGTIQIQPVVDFFGSNLSVGQHGGIWSGLGAPSTPSVFRLQVTAWYTNDDRSWVAALAPDLITQ